MNNHIIPFSFAIRQLHRISYVRFVFHGPPTTNTVFRSWICSNNRYCNSTNHCTATVHTNHITKSVSFSHRELSYHCIFHHHHRRPKIRMMHSNFSTTAIDDPIGRKDGDTVVDDNSQGEDRTTGTVPSNNAAITTTGSANTTAKSTAASKTRGIPLKKVIPKYVRLKFCNHYTEDIASDDEFDYATYNPETDPDLTQYVNPYYHGPNGNYDFTADEMKQYNHKVFSTMVYQMLHQHRSRSTPSVKRAHHAWWVRTKQLQALEDEYQMILQKNNNDDNTDEIQQIEERLRHFQRKKDKLLIDEYASDDGTSIEYYSSECQFTIKAIRERAIQHYSLPSDQEAPMSLVKPEDIVERTYNNFTVQYYDALRTKAWHTLTNLQHVLYYTRAERAIPIYVPKEYHKYVIEEDSEYWDQYRKDSLISELETLDPLGIGDNTITPQERGRRIAAWIRKHPTAFTPK